MIPQEKIEQAAEKVNPYKHGTHPTVFKDAFTAGVRFAESELGQPNLFDIDFCGHVKAKIEVSNGNITIIASINGYGDALDPDQIIITQDNP